MRITVEREIAAPVAEVFEVISHVDKFAEAVPHVVRLEFLTEQKSGVGTRFRETRLMNGKEFTSDLEITECEPDSHVRIVTASGGTTWDTVMTVEPSGDQARFRLVMDARARKFGARIMNAVFKRMIANGVARDIDLLKEHCETVTP